MITSDKYHNNISTGFGFWKRKSAYHPDIHEAYPGSISYFQITPYSGYWQRYRWPALFIVMIFLGSVSGCSNKQMRNFNAIPSFSSKYVNAVVEIPAGTNRKVEYNEDKRMFLVEQVDGSDRVIDFLPYPGNFGFIPGTFIDPAMGGDGHQLDIMVIAESLPTGTVIEVIPLIVLYFEVDSGFDSRIVVPRIIAVPANERQRIIKAVTYEDIFENYPDLVDILVKWFISYKGDSFKKLKALGDSDMALNEIKKWDVRRF